MSNIRLVKLITGEEIIGTVVEQMDGSIKITDIVQLAQVSQKQLGYIPFLPYCNTKEGLILKPSQFILMFPVNPELEDAYNKTFSKIVVPAKPELKLSGF